MPQAQAQEYYQELKNIFATGNKEPVGEHMSPCADQFPTAKIEF